MNLSRKKLNCIKILHCYTSFLLDFHKTNSGVKHVYPILLGHYLLLIIASALFKLFKYQVLARQVASKAFYRLFRNSIEYQSCCPSICSIIYDRRDSDFFFSQNASKCIKSLSVTTSRAVPKVFQQYNNFTYHLYKSFRIAYGIQFIWKFNRSSFGYLMYGI